MSVTLEVWTYKQFSDLESVQEDREFELLYSIGNAVAKSDPNTDFRVEPDSEGTLVLSIWIPYPTEDEVDAYVPPPSKWRDDDDYDFLKGIGQTIAFIWERIDYDLKED